MRRTLLSCVALLALGACGGGGGELPAVSAVGEGTVDAADAQALGGEAAVTAMQELYRAARDSGKTTVTVYGPGEKDREPLYEVFSQRFPEIDVTPVYIVGPEATAKIQAEFASGQHVADLVQEGNTSVSPQIAEGKLVPFRPVTAEGSGFAEPTGHATAASGSVFGIVYNTNLMSPEDAPKGWADLLDPAYRGKMTSDETTRNGGSFGVLSHLLWDVRYDDAFLQGLAAQEITMQASGAVAGSAVATGQFALDPFYPYSFYLRDKEQGAPIEFVFPTEGGVHVSEHYLALLEGAPNPDAAKLLMTWLFTPEGQQAAADIGYYPLMPDSPAPGGYPSVNELDLLKPFTIDQVGQVSADNLARVKNAWGVAS
ncbi:ABC transporter substrate-binding protein [Pseudonocardia sp. DLS-67]